MHDLMIYINFMLKKNATDDEWKHILILQWDILPILIPDDWKKGGKIADLLFERKKLHMF